MVSFDRRRALRATLAALSSQSIAGFPDRAAARTSTDEASDQSGDRLWISVFDSRFFGGAKGDGITDDTAAIAAAAAAAAASGLTLYMAGRFAVANLKLPGLGGYLHIVGDPVLIQARANTSCLMIEDEILQQSLGCRLTCTVIPHPRSSKNNAANVAVNLTGFSSCDITVRLGQAAQHANDSGRFHTVIYADAASPFHYGNRLRIIANAVPAPKYGIRYTNRAKGVSANPNINTLSGWFNALDTVAGDVLIDVGDTTQTIIEGPTLIEACPGATGIRAGNFTTVRDVWFEQLGLTLDFSPTDDTVPNNCRIERCQFSGSGHVVRVAAEIIAPPSFVDCIGDASIAFRNRAGEPAKISSHTRSHVQPAVPTIQFVQGGGAITPDQASLRRRVNSLGQTTYQLRYFVRPSAIGNATIRISPSDGYEVEQATLGIRDMQGRKLAWALSDNLSGSDYDWTWENTDQHVINIRVTLCSRDQ